MKILFYSYKDFEKAGLETANKNNYEVASTAEPLSPATTSKAEGFDTVSVFTADDVSAEVLNDLYKNGVRYVSTRAAGYDNIDIQKAKELGIKVANVPEYSPYAIAEFALTLILTLNRKIIRSNKQVQQQDFTISNLVGFDLHRKTIGVIGTGKIGRTFLKIMQGFDCRLIAYDIDENKDIADQYGLEYVSIETLCREADIISIHTGLTPQTKYMINKKTIDLMKPGVMLINTGRGGCVNTEDVIEYLEKGHIGYYGADVYEKEKGIFFNDWAGKELNDDTLKKLMSMPNVLITPHQAFATNEALANIAETTFYNIECWANDQNSPNELPAH